MLSQYPIDRRNRFDELRVFAAALVIFSHSWPIFGAQDQEPFVQMTGHMTGGQLAVAVFFIISGFLIYRSATYSQPLRFLVARTLRIVPGATACALVTVLVLGPLATTLEVVDYFSRGQTWSYLKTAVPFSLQSGLPGVFEKLPYPNAVNGSLWTLPIELRLYIVCAILVYVLRHRMFLFALLLILGALFLFRAEILATAGGRSYWLVIFGWYFFAGSVLYELRNYVPINWIAAAIATGAIVATAGSDLFPYAIAIGLPYLVIWIAFAGTIERRSPELPDISYGLYIYGFPVQQLTALVLLDTLPFYGLMIVSLLVAGLAGTVSWYAIEKPTLDLKSRFGNAR